MNVKSSYNSFENCVDEIRSLHRVEFFEGVYTCDCKNYQFTAYICSHVLASHHLQTKSAFDVIVRDNGMTTGRKGRGRPLANRGDCLDISARVSRLKSIVGQNIRVNNQTFTVTAYVVTTKLYKVFNVVTEEYVDMDSDDVENALVAFQSYISNAIVSSSSRMTRIIPEASIEIDDDNDSQ